MPTPEEIRAKLGCRIEVGDVVTLEDVRILWPNFSGAADKYNSEGDRNFQIHLPQPIADQLARDGWNVKCKFPRPEENTDEQDERCLLKIVVKYKIKPPKITWIGSKSRARTEITKDNVGLLDSADFKTVDLSFVPHFYEISPTNFGVNAYLKTMYCVVNEDELDEKWADPEAVVE